jgi:hypothetical protein
LHLDLLAAQWDFKVGRGPRLVSISAGEEVFLGQIPLILPDIYVVKLGGVAGLYLDLLCYFSAGMYPVALRRWPKMLLKLHSSTLNLFSRA